MSSDSNYFSELSSTAILTSESLPLTVGARLDFVSPAPVSLGALLGEGLFTSVGFYSLSRMIRSFWIVSVTGTRPPLSRRVRSWPRAPESIFESGL